MIECCRLTVQANNMSEVLGFDNKLWERSHMLFQHPDFLSTKENYMSTATYVSHMEREKQQFWTAVILGFLVMILVAILNVNTLGLIPVLGPFAGGIIPGSSRGKAMRTVQKQDLHRASLA